MNNIFCKNGFSGVVAIAFISLSMLSEAVFARPTVTITADYIPSWTGGYSGGSGTSSTDRRGDISNSSRILDLRGVSRGDKAKKKEECKKAAVSQLQSCNSGVTALHTMNSSWCRGAYWVGGALGVLGGWAYADGSAGGALLLAGSGYAVYQWGDDCQTDMDRAYAAALADCSAKQIEADNACEAM